MTMSVPVKVMTLIILIYLLSVKTGLCMKQTGTCRPFCSGSDCVTLNQDRVDYKTAEEACRDRNGELMTFQPETTEKILDNLSQELYGDFWIGLRLPAGSCSNLSAPLRGYEWTSGGSHHSFIPSFSTWKDSVQACAPRCVSLSNDQKLTERPCSDKTDGFLCRTQHKDACQAQELTDSHFFQSSEDCSGGPCEHTCTDVKGGYKCSCISGYIPDDINPRRCKQHCAQQKCPVICDRNDNNVCYCPKGYIRNEKICEDIDECLSGECDQGCKNTLGGFVCSCGEGFALKDQGKCIKAAHGEVFVMTTPVVEGFVKTATKNNTLQGSSAPGGSFLWIWISFAVSVVVCIYVTRYCILKRQKRREQNSIQQSAANVDNNEC